MPKSAVPFTVGDAIGVGWTLAMRHLGLLVLVTLVAGALTAVPELIGDSAVWSIVGVLVSMVVTLGYVKIVLNIVDEKPAAMGDLFSCIHLVPQYFVATIVYVVVVGVGLILLVVPGIIWAIKFFFYDFPIVDEETGPFTGLSRSAAVTQGAKGRLFLLFLALLGINILGLLALVVGLLVSIPITGITLAHVYRRLSQAESQPAAAA